jgi:DNA-binding NarL/FixJ family response regulator
MEPSDPHLSERPETQAIRVLIDDHEIVRAGLRAILASEADFDVVGELGPADDPGPVVARIGPDVLLLNPRLPIRNGPDICAQLTRRHPNLRILIVSTYAEIDLVRSCIGAGAHGYVLRDIGRLELARAVRAVHHGEVAVSSEVAGRIIDQMRTLVRVRTQPADWRLPTSDDPTAPAPSYGPFPPEVSGLTSREREVLDRFVSGDRVRSIAADLFVSQSTVRNHLSSIFRKVGVRSQDELMRAMRPV